MGAPSTRTPGQHPHHRGGVGIHEGNLQVASGLRNSSTSGLLNSDPLAVALYSGAKFRFLIPTWTDVEDLDGGGGMTERMLSVPCTPCITISRDALTAPGQVFQFRLSGIDQFGNDIVETLPQFTVQQVGYDKTTIAPIARQWASKVFSAITKVEAKLAGGVLTASDGVTIGTSFHWEGTPKPDAVLFKPLLDLPTGTIELIVAVPGGSPETTAAIDTTSGWNAANIKTQLELLASITTVTVTGTSGNDLDVFHITFDDPVRGWTEVTLDSSGLSAGTVHWTGEEWYGHANLGVGTPFRINPYGPEQYKGLGLNRYSELVYLHVRNMENQVGTPTRPQMAIVPPVRKVSGVRQNAGFELGRNASGYQGTPHKWSIYANLTNATAAHELLDVGDTATASRAPYVGYWSSGNAFGHPQYFDMGCRTMLGTYQMPNVGFNGNDESSYPR